MDREFAAGARRDSRAREPVWPDLITNQRVCGQEFREEQLPDRDGRLATCFARLSVAPVWRLIVPRVFPSCR
ncbi:MAG: hypothetical protein ACKOJF_09310, partial [Planctomycetaceae bacterium]